MAGTQEPDEEIARLRQEVERLRAAASKREGRRLRPGWWRTPVAAILIVITGILAPVAVLATWARDVVEDTDRYVETITPLGENPAVQKAISSRIEEIVFGYVDVDAVTRDVADALRRQDLPPRVDSALDALVVPLSTGIRSFVSDRIDALVRSDEFQTAWIEANRAAHTQLVAVLTGHGTDSVNVTDGSVQIDLAGLLDAVEQRLADNGFTLATRIPDLPDTHFTIFESADLPKAQGVFRLLDDLATLLPIIALVSVTVAVMIARDRRRTLFAGAVTIALSMLVLGAILNLVRPLYLDSVPADGVSIDAAAAVFDTLVGFIRLALRAILVVALTVALIAWLSTPNGAGAALRAHLMRWVDALRSRRVRAGLSTGRIGEFLGTYRTAVRMFIVGCAAVMYILQSHPSGTTALTFVAAAVVLVGAAEVLAASRGPT